ncbi:MAG: M20 family metallo-hydrolase [Chloroflexota bacterium]
MYNINQHRLLADLDALAAIGCTPDGGISRPAMSFTDVEGRSWFQQRVNEFGLEFRADGAGNLSAILPSTSASAQTLLMGSHLDSVPNGGRFDGVLGVLSALEVLRTVSETELKLPVHLEAISFTDEEGQLLALIGSRAVAGLLTEADLQQPRGNLEGLHAGMQRLGITSESVLNARRADILAYLEIHIEQGTRLEEASLNLGVVTSIVGVRSFWLRFIGQSAHAGTMPMQKRADALWGATAFIQAARTLIMEHFFPGVMNVGQLYIQPSAFNSVPAEVKLALEFRHGTTPQLDEMETALFDLAQQAAQQSGLTLEIECVGRYTPAQMDEALMRAIEIAADMLDLSHTRLLSFAGHDAQSLSTITPSGMIFVPSVGGISHSPLEFTKPEEVINGANTLLQTVLNLAQNI